MERHHSDFEGGEQEPSQHSQCNNTGSDIRSSKLRVDPSSLSIPHPYPLVTDSAGDRHHNKYLVPKPVDLDSEVGLLQRLPETGSEMNISQRTSTKPARVSHLQPPTEKCNLRHKLTNGDYSMLDASKDSDAHMEVGSHVPAAPDIGAEAPEPPLDNVRDVEEAADDVEFPEAVVLVGKTHWRCITCMACFSRSTSIDDHVSVQHPQQALTQNTTPAPKRGRGRGRGMARGRISNHASRKPHLEIEQRPLRSSLRPTQGTDGGRASRGKWVSAHGKPSLRRRGGRGMRGSRGGRGRSRGGRGRGRVFTKPLTSDDSDTEVDVRAQSPPLKVSRKRRTRTSSGLNEDEPADMLPPPPSKKPKTKEDDVPPPEEIPVDSPPPSPEPVSHDTLKDLMKEKYIVIVEKSGASDNPSECEFEAHLDNDPPLPIETPSLQADALLPPATPVLPDIHGPPETPILPETPHPPGTPHHADSFQPPEMPDPTDSQESTHPHKFLPPETPGILPAIAPETVTKTQGRTSAEGHSVAAAGFSSSRGPVVQHSDSNPLSVCRTCGAAFDSSAELRSHREEMIKFDVVSCNDCGDKFHGLHQLNIHVFTIHEKFAKKFCFLCDADCLDGFELEEHLLEHTTNETDREDDVDNLDSIQHLCKTCGIEVAGNLSDLMNHYHTTHDQFICTKCYELFMDLTEYEDHKVLHASVIPDVDAPVVYTCPVSDCYQMCSDKEALMDHISWHEDRDLDEEQLGLLHCQHCSDQFRNKVSLQRHLAETHNEPDLKPFVCELCSEDFSHSLELHRHNTIHHAGIKRYGCAYCNQRFAFRSSHRRHVASEHDVAATVLHM